MPSKTFKVYFNQVNQTRYQVNARTLELAVRKATKMWLEEHGLPTGTYVEDEKGNKVNDS